MLPRKHIYENAASVILKAKRKEGAVKNLCFSDPCKNKRKLFALVCESLKHRVIIQKVIEKAGDIWKGCKIKPDNELQLVLLYELLFGRGVDTKSPYHDVLLTNKSDLSNTLDEVKECFPGILVAKQRSKNVILPRYVRVNSLKKTQDAVVQAFVEEGYLLVTDKHYNELDGREFCVDGDVENLLVFSNGSDLHTHPLYRDGSIILQDKASCLPAFILNPPPGSIVIDGCSAPGNKSSHLAAIMENRGKLYSFDLDKRRLQTMQEFLKKTGCKVAKTKHQDFLKVRHDDPVYSNVEYILLDPSCSGSGIVSRMDDLLDEEDEMVSEKRLKGLSGFQTAALSHALSFPHVKKVVYSTCSVHRQENEDVVLKASKRFADTFKLVHILPEWKNRGLDQASECIRAVPETDFTNGFFVAMFERTSPTNLKSERNEVQLDDVKIEADDLSFSNDPVVPTPSEITSARNQSSNNRKRKKKSTLSLKVEESCETNKNNDKNMVIPGVNKNKENDSIFSNKVPKKKRKKKSIKRPIA